MKNRRSKKTVSLALLCVMMISLLTAVMTVNVSAAYLFEETFDDDKYADRGWELPSGKTFPLFSTEIFYEGKGSMMVDSMANQSMTIVKEFSEVFVEIWFYDDPDQDAMDAMALVYDENLTSNIAVIGVRSATSATHYTYRTGGTSSFAETTVERTKGWHKFLWDLTTPGKADMYIDGVLIGTKTDINSVGQLGVGNFWAGVGPAKYYFDSLRVYEPGNAPPDPSEPEPPVEIIVVAESASEPPAENPVVTTEAPAVTTITAPQTGDIGILSFALILILSFASTVVIVRRKDMK